MIRKNWGFPFVAVFLLLLSTAAVLSATRMASIAETVATFAYFLLIIGAVLQLVSKCKNNFNKGEFDFGSD